MQTTEDQSTQCEQDRAFLLWYIDQYLDGKADADDLLCAIKTVKPVTEEEQA